MGYNSVSVEPQEYAGCPITHPSIVSSIKTMIKDGKKDEEIMRVVGMPYEVVRKYRREYEFAQVKKK